VEIHSNTERYGMMGNISLIMKCFFAKDAIRGIGMGSRPIMRISSLRIYRASGFHYRNGMKRDGSPVNRIKPHPPENAS